MNPTHPYFCRSTATDRETECFASIDDAVRAAEDLRLAPFIVMQLIPMPIQSRITNGRREFDERMRLTPSAPVSGSPGEPIVLGVKKF